MGNLEGVREAKEKKYISEEIFLKEKKAGRKVPLYIIITVDDLWLKLGVARSELGGGVYSGVIREKTLYSGHVDIYLPSRSRGCFLARGHITRKKGVSRKGETFLSSPSDPSHKHQIPRFSLTAFLSFSKGKKFLKVNPFLAGQKSGVLKSSVKRYRGI